LFGGWLCYRSLGWFTASKRSGTLHEVCLLYERCAELFSLERRVVFPSRAFNIVVHEPLSRYIAFKHSYPLKGKQRVRKYGRRVVGSGK
jgi:hypothetical protein